MHVPSFAQILFAEGQQLCRMVDTFDKIRYNTANERKAQAVMEIDLLKAKEILEKENLTCVLCKGERRYDSDQRGVKPLLAWLDAGVDVMGFSAADKVVGRGAAFLYRLLGVRRVHGGVMSVAAVKVLRAGGIEAQWALLAEGIRNRNNTGPCPIEYSTAVTEDPEEALMIIRAELNMRGE
jgi:hypothetical protein